MNRFSKNRLADDARAPRRRHERHQLRLQIGGKSGERLRLDRHRLEMAAVARDAYATIDA